MAIRKFLHASCVTDIERNAWKPQSASVDHLGRIVDTDVILADRSKVSGRPSRAHADIENWPAVATWLNHGERSLFRGKQAIHAGIMLCHGWIAVRRLVCPIKTRSQLHRRYTPRLLDELSKLSLRHQRIQEHEGPPAFRYDAAEACECVYTQPLARDPPSHRLAQCNTKNRHCGHPDRAEPDARRPMRAAS